MVGLDLLRRLIRALILVYLMDQYGPRTLYDSIVQEQTGDPQHPSVGYASGHSVYGRSAARLRPHQNYFHLHSFSSSSKELQSHLQIEASAMLLEDSRDSISNHSLLSNGREHTDISKAKISAANKGKVPWNAGMKHSEETKRKIAEKTRAAVTRKKLQQAMALDMTLEQYEAFVVQEKEQKRQSKLKGGLTSEGRQRISESMKARWSTPGYKENYSNSTKGSRNHSEETRSRISEAIKLKWQDEAYRSKERVGPSAEVRARISAKLKSKWEDPEFRLMMMNHSFVRTNEWKLMISDKIREKWLDPSYRTAVEQSVRAYFNAKGSSSSRRHRPRRSSSNSRVRLSPEEVFRKRADALLLKEETARIRRETLQMAKMAARRKDKSTNLKDILGGELWFEEKMKRKRNGELFQDDASLESQLLEEWGNSAEDDDTIAPGGYDFRDVDEDLDEPLQGGIPQPHLSNEYFEEDEYEDDDEDDEDMIEVYDERGELVGVYNLIEFQRIQSASKR